MLKMFRNYSKEEILNKLESRLDHVVFLLGFAKSPRIARQLVSHGHIHVNGRKVTIPSYYVRMKDIVAVRLESRPAKIFEDIQLRLKQYTPPEWLKLKAEELKGECVAKPPAVGAQLPFDINVVGQFYSR